MQTAEPPAVHTRAGAEAGRRSDSSDAANHAGAAILLTPNVLAVKHWSRLLGGLLYATTARIDWATLLRRSFDVDVLRCAKCGEGLHLLGEITDPAMIRLVLEGVGIPSEAPRPARARDPTELLGDPGVD
jgi:hypothetical protein